MAKKQVVAVLVAGPFAEKRSTSTDILERWRHLTGRQGHPADPEFASYLSATLATLVLDGGQARAFERLLNCLARLMGGQGQADELMNQAEAARAALEPARFADRTWQTVRKVIDDRSQRTAFDEALSNDLRDLGLTRPADHVLVGLTVSRTIEPDPVDEAIRRDAFQRASADLAHATGEVVAGQVGDHGVVFLCGKAGPATRKRQKVLDLAERVFTLGRKRFGLSLHFGASLAPANDPLSRSYQSALGAAEAALVGDAKLVIAEPGSRRPRHSLRHLRQELSRAVEERPDLLGARFDRYLEAVAVHCVYRMKPARAHLEAGFERMAEALVKSGALDEKSFGVLGDGLDRAAGEARTVSELFAAYRKSVFDLATAVQRPAHARRDRGLQGALDYIRQRYSEPLSRAKVARVAGFAPRYFSALFKKREHTTFEQYLHGLRIERAKQLLEDSSVDAARVAELSGFRTPQYFSRVFRRATGTTPLEFRRKSPRVAANDAKKPESRKSHRKSPKV